MDAQVVFAFLKKQKKAVLLDYLQAAYGELNPNQRRAIFAAAVHEPPRARVKGDELRQEIDQFRNDSLARKYYKPFNVNSKNFREIPEATRDWCARFARFATEISRLTARGEHAQAVACFAMLFELVKAVDWGKEIIYAEEVGPWLIPADEKAWLKDYLTSLAATATPEAFAAAAIPIVERDSFNSFAAQVYASALNVANPQQQALLNAELARKQIRIGPKA